MSTYDADLPERSGIDWRGDIGVVQYGSDKNMVVLFYMRPVHNPQKSAAQGVPIFEDRVYVKVHPPGERFNIVDRPADGKDAKRWPIQWHQFSQNMEQKPDGVPVGLLYPDRPAIEATLRASQVHTVEQLANLSTTAIEQIGMGCQSWVNAAQRYLEIAARGVSGSQMRRELEERDREINALNHKLNLAMEEITRLKTDKASNGMSVSDQIAAEVQKALGNMTGRPQFPVGGATNLDPQGEQIANLGKTKAAEVVTAAKKGVKKQKM